MPGLILHNSFFFKDSVQFNILGSKSISQRALIIHNLMNVNLKIKNLSDSEDTSVLLRALSNSDRTIDVQYSGTALRFLISLFAFQNRDVILIGQETLFKRPIEPLILALNSLGAQIIKKANSIYIKNSNLSGGIIDFNKIHSSQFISSLLLISPYLKNGVILNLPPKYNSKSYVHLTTSMMINCGAQLSVSNSSIQVYHKPYSKFISDIESDWTSVSYLFVAFLFSELQQIKITRFFASSVQPDCMVIDFFTLFGIKSMIENNELTLKKVDNITLPNKIEWDFQNNGDLFPTILVACAGIGVNLIATGINTLRYKESNRIISMTRELSKFNCFFKIEEDTIYMDVVLSSRENKHSLICIETYHDHRIALAIAPLVLLNWKLKIDNSEIVNKSYPNFWLDLVKFGVEIKYIDDEY